MTKADKSASLASDTTFEMKPGRDQHADTLFEKGENTDNMSENAQILERKDSDASESEMVKGFDDGADEDGNEGRGSTIYEK